MMAEVHRISDFDEMTGSGKQTRWTLQGFVLVRENEGEYVFRHPDEGGVTIIVRTDSTTFREMVQQRELGVKLVFKEGKFEPLTKDPTVPDEGAHRIILEKKEGS